MVSRIRSGAKALCVEAFHHLPRRCRRLRTGKPKTRPSGVPYSPWDTTASDTQSPAAVGVTMLRTESTTALAADAADDAPRASMIWAPALLDGGDELALRATRRRR